MGRVQVRAVQERKQAESQFTKERSKDTKEASAMSMRVLGLASAVAIAAVVGSHAGPAIAFPDRPVHFVVPYNPGGTVDPTARIMANAISEGFGEPVVVENRAGAAGSVGTEYVVRANADGHTVLIHTNIVASEPCLKPDLPYDFLASMKPVAKLVETPFVVLVHPSVPAETIEELVDHLNERPGELNFGASASAPPAICAASSSRCRPARTSSSSPIRAGPRRWPGLPATRSRSPSIPCPAPSA
jgi:tripartite-type tricarboxylate transporter receptor subunit TctC